MQDALKQWRQEYMADIPIYFFSIYFSSGGLYQGLEISHQETCHCERKGVQLCFLWEENQEPEASYMM